MVTLKTIKHMQTVFSRKRRSSRAGKKNRGYALREDNPVCKIIAIEDSDVRLSLMLRSRKAW